MVWRHPKYYKELKKIRKEFERRQASSQAASQAASVKPQGSQDEGDKHQAASGKDQASSRKRQAP